MTQPQESDRTWNTNKGEGTMTKVWTPLLILAAMLLSAAPAAAETAQEVSEHSCTYVTYVGVRYYTCPEGEISLAQAELDLARLTQYAPGLTSTLEAGLGAKTTAWWFNYHTGLFMIRMPEYASEATGNKLDEEINSRFAGWIPEGLMQWSSNNWDDARIAANKATLETGYNQKLTKYVAEGLVKIEVDLKDNGLRWVPEFAKLTTAQESYIYTACAVTGYLTNGFCRI